MLIVRVLERGGVGSVERWVIQDYVIKARVMDSVGERMKL